MDKEQFSTEQANRDRDGGKDRHVQGHRWLVYRMILASALEPIVAAVSVSGLCICVFGARRRCVYKWQVV